MADHESQQSGNNVRFLPGDIVTITAMGRTILGTVISSNAFESKTSEWSAESVKIMTEYGNIEEWDSDVIEHVKS